MNRIMSLPRSVVVLLVVCCAGRLMAAPVSVNRQTQTVLVVANGTAVSLQPWSAGTVRVEAAPGETIPEKKSFTVITTPDATGWSVSEEIDRVVLKGPRMTAAVDKKTGLVSFSDAKGQPLFAQKNWSFQPAQDQARDGLAIKAIFARGAQERFYGGGVIGGKLQNPSADIRLINNNTDIQIPVLYSSLGYGFFWDNASRGGIHLRPDSVTWEASAGDLADFYVMAGPEADAVVAEYRNLTGAAPLFPEWAYGFWFSKNRFTSQKEILAAAQAFRDHQFPVDLLVQDYWYWKADTRGLPIWDGWGSHKFVASRYPDPKAMIDELHSKFNLHLMTVVWPRFDIASDHAKELDGAHALLPLSGRSGWEEGTRFYDPFSADGRKIYGRQVMNSLLSLGMDGWWMDGAEPEIPNNIMAKFETGAGPASRVMDAYPLMHTESLYQAQRAVTESKRVVLLPRSSWAGMQRYAAANWTGDIHQDWATLGSQIDGLQNYSISGLPYITTDVGGYGPTPEADRELFVRWFEWGTFCPIFRVHGVDRPFPWDYGTPAEPILKKFDMLRYRLLPYIYSQAADVTFASGTMMRPLVMDFRADPKALDVRDEFMFGPSLLVCPVYSSLKTTVGSLEQVKDSQGQAGGITATFVGKDGKNTVARRNLKNESGFQFKDDPTAEQRSAASIVMEGTFTPDQDGPMAVEVSEPHPEGYPASASIDGKPVATEPLNGDWQFPSFPFVAKKGVPVRFSLETKMHFPGFRFVRKSPGPQRRDVYLPRTTGWYDFWTGQPMQGAKSMQVETPLEMIPLYVRAGSIIPMGPEQQYVGEKPDAPLELRVYRGADGSFTWYQDEGDNYNYEKGAHAETLITWKQVTKTLTFGARRGSFAGMPAKRTFHVVWVTTGHGGGEEPTAKADAVVSYEGKEISIQAPSAF